MSSTYCTVLGSRSRMKGRRGGGRTVGCGGVSLAFCFPAAADASPPFALHGCDFEHSPQVL